MIKKTDEARRLLRKKLNNDITNILLLFEKVQEWADLSNILQKLYLTIEKYDVFVDVSSKFLLFRRLSQCLNPLLPSGVHSKALIIYSVIFKKAERSFFINSIHILCSGIFEFMLHCTINLKTIYFKNIKSILNLRENVYIFAYALLLSLFNVVDSDNNILLYIYSINNYIGEKIFFNNIWLLLLRHTEIRTNILHFLETSFSPQIHLLSNDRINMLLPFKDDLVLSSLIFCLKDKSIINQRITLSLLINNFPLSQGNFRNRRKGAPWGGGRSVDYIPRGYPNTQGSGEYDVRNVNHGDTESAVVRSASYSARTVQGRSGRVGEEGVTEDGVSGTLRLSDKYERGNSKKRYYSDKDLEEEGGGEYSSGLAKASHGSNPLMGKMGGGVSQSMWSSNQEIDIKNRGGSYEYQDEDSFRQSSKEEKCEYNEKMLEKHEVDGFDGPLQEESNFGNDVRMDSREGYTSSFPKSDVKKVRYDVVPERHNLEGVGTSTSGRSEMGLKEEMDSSSSPCVLFNDISKKIIARNVIFLLQKGDIGLNRRIFKYLYLFENNDEKNLKEGIINIENYKVFVETVIDILQNKFHDNCHSVSQVLYTLLKNIDYVNINRQIMNKIFLFLLNFCYKNRSDKRIKHFFRNVLMLNLISFNNIMNIFLCTFYFLLKNYENMIKQNVDGYTKRFTNLMNIMTFFVDFLRRMDRYIYTYFLFSFSIAILKLMKRLNLVFLSLFNKYSHVRELSGRYFVDIHEVISHRHSSLYYFFFFVMHYNNYYLNRCFILLSKECTFFRSVLRRGGGANQVPVQTQMTSPVEEKRNKMQKIGETRSNGMEDDYKSPDSKMKYEHYSNDKELKIRMTDIYMDYNMKRKVKKKLFENDMSSLSASNTSSIYKVTPLQTPQVDGNYHLHVNNNRGPFNEGINNSRGYLGGPTFCHNGGNTSSNYRVKLENDERFFYILLKYREKLSRNLKDAIVKNSDLYYFTNNYEYGIFLFYNYHLLVEKEYVNRSCYFFLRYILRNCTCDNEDKFYFWCVLFLQVVRINFNRSLLKNSKTTEGGDGDTDNPLGPGNMYYGKKKGVKTQQEDPLTGGVSDVTEGQVKNQNQSGECNEVRIIDRMNRKKNNTLRNHFARTEQNELLFNIAFMESVLVYANKIVKCIFHYIKVLKRNKKFIKIFFDINNLYFFCDNMYCLKILRDSLKCKDNYELTINVKVILQFILNNKTSEYQIVHSNFYNLTHDVFKLYTRRNTLINYYMIKYIKSNKKNLAYILDSIIINMFDLINEIEEGLVTSGVVQGSGVHGGGVHGAGVHGGGVHGASYEEVAVSGGLPVVSSAATLSDPRISAQNNYEKKLRKLKCKFDYLNFFFMGIENFMLWLYKHRVSKKIYNARKKMSLHNYEKNLQIVMCYICTEGNMSASYFRNYLDVFFLLFLKIIYINENVGEIGTHAGEVNNNANNNGNDKGGETSNENVISTVGAINEDDSFNATSTANPINGINPVNPSTGGSTQKEKNLLKQSMLLEFKRDVINLITHIFFCAYNYNKNMDYIKILNSYYRQIIHHILFLYFYFTLKKYYILQIQLINFIKNILPLYETNTDKNVFSCDVLEKDITFGKVMKHTNYEEFILASKYQYELINRNNLLVKNDVFIFSILRKSMTILFNFNEQIIYKEVLKTIIYLIENIIVEKDVKAYYLTVFFLDLLYIIKAETEKKKKNLFFIMKFCEFLSEVFKIIYKDELKTQLKLPNRFEYDGNITVDDIENSLCEGKISTAAFCTVFSIKTDDKFISVQQKNISTLFSVIFNLYIYLKKKLRVYCRNNRSLLTQDDRNAPPNSSHYNNNSSSLYNNNSSVYNNNGSMYNENGSPVAPGTASGNMDPLVGTIDPMGSSINPVNVSNSDGGVFSNVFAQGGDTLAREGNLMKEGSMNRNIAERDSTDGRRMSSAEHAEEAIRMNQGAFMDETIHMGNAADRAMRMNVEGEAAMEGVMNASMGNASDIEGLRRNVASNLEGASSYEQYAGGNYPYGNVSAHVGDGHMGQVSVENLPVEQLGVVDPLSMESLVMDSHGVGGTLNGAQHLGGGNHQVNSGSDYLVQNYGGDNGSFAFSGEAYSNGKYIYRENLNKQNEVVTQGIYGKGGDGLNSSMVSGTYPSAYYGNVGYENEKIQMDGTVPIHGDTFGVGGSQQRGDNLGGGNPGIGLLRSDIQGDESARKHMQDLKSETFKNNQLASMMGEVDMETGPVGVSTGGGRSGVVVGLGSMTRDFSLNVQSDNNTFTKTDDSTLALSNRLEHTFLYRGKLRSNDIPNEGSKRNKKILLLKVCLRNIISINKLLYFVTRSDFLFIDSLYTMFKEYISKRKECNQEKESESDDETASFTHEHRNRFLKSVMRVARIGTGHQLEGNHPHDEDGSDDDDSCDGNYNDSENDYEKDEYNDYNFGANEHDSDYDDSDTDSDHDEQKIIEEHVDHFVDDKGAIMGRTNINMSSGKKKIRKERIREYFRREKKLLKKFNFIGKFAKSSMKKSMIVMNESGEFIEKKKLSFSLTLLTEFHDDILVKILDDLLNYYEKYKTKININEFMYFVFHIYLNICTLTKRIINCFIDFMFSLIKKITQTSQNIMSSLWFLYILFVIENNHQYVFNDKLQKKIILEQISILIQISLYSYYSKNVKNNYNVQTPLPSFVLPFNIHYVIQDYFISNNFFKKKKKNAKCYYVKNLKLIERNFNINDYSEIAAINALSFLLLCFYHVVVHSGTSGDGTTSGNSANHGVVHGTGNTTTHATSHSNNHASGNHQGGNASNANQMKSYICESSVNLFYENFNKYLSLIYNNSLQNVFFRYSFLLIMNLLIDYNYNCKYYIKKITFDLYAYITNVDIRCFKALASIFKKLNESNIDELLLVPTSSIFSLKFNIINSRINYINKLSLIILAGNRNFYLAHLPKIAENISEYLKFCTDLKLYREILILICTIIIKNDENEIYIIIPTFISLIFQIYHVERMKYRITLEDIKNVDKDEDNYIYDFNSCNNPDVLSLLKTLLIIINILVKRNVSFINFYSWIFFKDISIKKNSFSAHRDMGNYTRGVSDDLNQIGGISTSSAWDTPVQSIPPVVHMQGVGGGNTHVDPLPFGRKMENDSETKEEPIQGVSFQPDGRTTKMNVLNDGEEDYFTACAKRKELEPDGHKDDIITVLLNANQEEDALSKGCTISPSQIIMNTALQNKAKAEEGKFIAFLDIIEKLYTPASANTKQKLGSEAGGEGNSGNSAIAATGEGKPTSTSPLPPVQSNSRNNQANDQGIRFMKELENENEEGDFHSGYSNNVKKNLYYCDNYLSEYIINKKNQLSGYSSCENNLSSSSVNSVRSNFSNNFSKDMGGILSDSSDDPDVSNSSSNDVSHLSHLMPNGENDEEISSDDMYSMANDKWNHVHCLPNYDIYQLGKKKKKKKKKVSVHSCKNIPLILVYLSKKIKLNFYKYSMKKPKDETFILLKELNSVENDINDLFLEVDLNQVYTDFLMR
ncbi:conserved Plasmodium protein, unknown function [Plasmodium knowlesi strain H]|uniref:DOP1 N-terminal domain-containing protein n=3 Tax=Plasmodium knowlesi TaxID=5850 RepID=A0A5K1UPX1_PLAKH|nr:conserved Plasmodium protein, unknown function [Plasmodium knowlesi strain H]OTN65898.1 Uncharacterized protein PKNOH_S100065800 [Plasmodium knowlesi]CAA9988010.1 conserved Plasmodium protein, unknown function [Plasmodium knowlesi strain H]SBO22035.1 conserved Plasmodium protein, unknown function [Plasmodium knowlesi strain H]SBO29133.1 conserved Plasmodium protein, unknown function [Plasmodium knowlesi strain H]VVS77484.1 conserved Plasmodium protein, unknown function [Plasmodium knowlesi |eukprot:XP_002258989.1 hypothetical protein, conserved in Plasmodium species [Plasmodium knowlesi strain H]